MSRRIKPAAASSADFAALSQANRHAPTQAPEKPSAMPNAAPPVDPENPYSRFYTRGRSFDELLPHGRKPR